MLIIFQVNKKEIIPANENEISKYSLQLEKNILLTNKVHQQQLKEYKLQLSNTHNQENMPT